MTTTSSTHQKMRSHFEMTEKTGGPFSSIKAAAEMVASSMDFDKVCSSNSNSSTITNTNTNTSIDEDEEKQPLMAATKHNQPTHRERQSLLQQNQDQEMHYQQSQFNLRQQQQQQRQSSGSSFPHIDMHNLNLNNLGVNLSSLNINNLSLNNLSLNNLSLNNLNMNMNMNMENFDFHHLPEEIQMALEDTLLGWTHLTSITMGHVLVPWLVFCAVQWISKHVLEQTVYTLSSTTADGTTASTTMSTATATSSEGEFEFGEFGHAVEAVLVSPTTHAVLGAVAAIVTFRVIRHRRRVWFKHAYGSKAYKQCEEGRRRRAAVLEADKSRASLLSLSSSSNINNANNANNTNTANANTTNYSTPTWTSQMFTNYKRKRHKKKLHKASVRFERHHTGLSPKNKNKNKNKAKVASSASSSSSSSASTSSSTSSSLSLSQPSLSQPSHVVSANTNTNTKSRLNARPQKFWQGKDNDYDSTSLAPTEDCYDSSSSSASSSSSSENGDDHDRNRDRYHDHDTTDFDDNDCPNRSSIAHDAVSIPRIHNVPYAHGGFFGAAPFFLADKRWVKILRELLPDVYVEISRRVGGGYSYNYGRSSTSSDDMNNGVNMNDHRSDASKLIHWAENNPVVAAYGVVMDLQMKQELAALAANSMTKENKNESNFVEPNLSNPQSNETGNTSSSGNIIDHFYQKNNSNNSFGRNHPFNHKDSFGPDTNNPNIDEEGERETHIQTQTDAQKMVIPNLEWDIFVDPQLVRRVEAVLDAMDGYVASKTNINDQDQKQKQKQQHENHVSARNKEFRNVDGKSFSAMVEGSNSDCDCDTCAFGKGDGNENDTVFVDEDSGKSEADALLADQDYNSNNMININNNMIINNLCGNSSANRCTDCFQDPNNFNSNSSSNNNFVDFFARDAAGSPTEGICQTTTNLHDLKNDPVLRYLERELETRTRELTDRLLIAHGNVLQLILEQAGVLKDWNYSRVQRTRRTLGGGMYARQWMAVFAESLRLGMEPSRIGRTREHTHGRRARSCSSPDGGRKATGGIIDEPHNFYDEEGDADDDSSTEQSETDALLSYQNSGDPPFPEEDDDNLHNENPLGEDHDDSTEDDRHHCTCSPRCCLDTTMAESLELIEKITQTKQPIGILLDLKSRHVPKRVLSLMVRSLQAAGIRVVGIASFQISEIRGVCSNHLNRVCDSYSSYVHSQPFSHSHSSRASNKIPLGNEPHFPTTKEILMVHSAGDLQAACDEGLVQPGDHVFFNGGSLILDSARSSTLKSLMGLFFDMCACGYYNTFDPCAIEDGYKIQSYGYACGSMDAMETAGCFPNDPKSLMGTPARRRNEHGLLHDRNHDDDDDTLLLPTTNSEDTEMGAVMKTLADYKKHYGFSMGLYLQEFSIDEAAARLLIDLVNQNPKVYDLGLAWGGINGMTVHGIQPGRFTSTDGYWNQRRLGKSWKDQF